MKQPILDHLQMHALGRQRAIKAQRLAEGFGLSIREINEVIHDLRESGLIIGSSKIRPFGYYIPETDDERRDCIRTYESEAMDMMRILTRMKKSIKQHVNIGSQLEIQF